MMTFGPPIIYVPICRDPRMVILPRVVGYEKREEPGGECPVIVKTDKRQL